MSARRESRSSIVPPATPRAHLTYWALLVGCVVVAAAASPACNKPSDAGSAAGDVPVAKSSSRR